MTTEVTLRKMYKNGRREGFAEATDIFLRKQLIKNPSMADARDMFDDLTEDYIREFAAENGITLK